MKHNVDVIIPVYNALDDLKICLESLYKYTDLENNRLVIINDNSPDEKVKPYIDAQTRHNVIIIHNEKNKGFSANINIGMAQSEINDVILLNSDTVVTENWVEKMLTCAYSSKGIGTVTPLSNNATLCSIPEFCRENSLPNGLTIDQTAAIVEECSFRKYPRITVAHGFCMLIKRDVIKSVGNFDADTFGRGYGEENDFCNRAEQMGYIHVMCDDTYIYHSGTKSFVSKEKEAYIREHERILDKRYPVQMHKNAVHCRDNPNGWVGNNASLYFDIWNGKKNVLYLLQSDFREGSSDNVGGTQFHVKYLMRELRNDMNVFVAARNGQYLQVTAYVGDKEHVFRFFVGEIETFPLLRNRSFASVFEHILRGFKIDIVHVHHTATISLDIFYEAQKLGIPVIYTVHDYYCVCPNITLIDENGGMCVGKKYNCEACLQRKKGIYEKNEYLRMWRAEFHDALNLCQKIIVPSESTLDIFTSYYPEFADKIDIIGHGMDFIKILNIPEEQIIYTDNVFWNINKIDTSKILPFVSGIAYLKDSMDKDSKVVLKISDRTGKSVYFPTNYCSDLIPSENGFGAFLPSGVLEDGNVSISIVLQRGEEFYASKSKKNYNANISFSQSERMKVAFIGGINEDKGGKAAAEIVKRTGNEFEWYIIGGIGEESLAKLNQNNLIKTGYYHQEDISTFLKYYQIDVVCILSKCPETFSYTLSEALQCHVPVIVTDIGALGQRVRECK